MPQPYYNAGVVVLNSEFVGLALDMDFRQLHLKCDKSDPVLKHQLGIARKAYLFSCSIAKHVTALQSLRKKD
jgi:hypothetical protein